MKVKLKEGYKHINNPEYVLLKIYGFDNQIEKTKEELSQLLFELECRMINYDNVLSELTDVEIMLKQLKYIIAHGMETDFETVRNEIERRRIFKIKRQFDRLYRDTEL